MKIKTLEVAGMRPAIHAMRNPFDSWNRSDTHVGLVGRRDAELSERLTKAGPSHSKHLRLIQVWAEIWGPRYWWQEFDTNRIGVEKISCSTMHTLTKSQLTKENFEWSGDYQTLSRMIEELNDLIEDYQQAAEHGTKLDADLAFRVLKQSIPECFIQRRTVMMSYQAIRNMYELREGHRLREWQMFRDWCETLPEAWLIIGRGEPKPAPQEDDDEDP